MSTSNRVPCTLVVCGTTVTNTRSCGSVGMLRIRHGRTFAAMPRSTIQTDPRSAAGVTGGLLRIQCCKQLVRQPVQRWRGYVSALGCAAKNLGCGGLLVRVGKAVEQVEQLTHGFAHMSLQAGGT